MPKGRANNPTGKGGRRNSPRDELGLIASHRRFVDAYLIHLSPTAAAIDAGYSLDSAGATGSKLLQRADVRDAIEVLKARRAQRVQVLQDDVVKELALVGFSDITRYAVQSDGSVALRKTGYDTVVDPLWSRAVQKVKRKSRTYIDHNENEVTEHEVEIALWSKTDALRQLLQHTGGDGSTKVQQLGKDGQPVDPSPGMTLDQLRALVQQARDVVAAVA